MRLDRLPKELQEYVMGLTKDESFQYYFAYDPVLDGFSEQRKKFDEKIDSLIDLLKKDCISFLDENAELELLKKMKEENALSIMKKMDERASNLIAEYMVLHGKIKAEDFDNILKLMKVTEEKNNEEEQQ